MLYNDGYSIILYYYDDIRRTSTRVVHIILHQITVENRMHQKPRDTLSDPVVVGTRHITRYRVEPVIGAPKADVYNACLIAQLPGK